MYTRLSMERRVIDLMRPHSQPLAGRRYRAPVCRVVAAFALGFAATPVPGTGQEPIRRGEIDLVIGAVEGDPEYLFEYIGALTLDADGRIYVGDRDAQDVRVYGPDGRYLFQVTRSGEGPGEIREIVCGLVFDPDGRLWIDAWDSYKVFDIQEAGADHVRDVLPPDEARRITTADGTTSHLSRTTNCVRPMFAGPTGLTVAVDHFFVDDEGEIDAEWQQVQIGPDGSVHRRVTIPERDLGDISWPVMILRHATGPREIELPPPFANLNILVHSPDGTAAHLYTREYLVQLFDEDGQVRHEIRRYIAGPRVTEAEALQERERLDRTRDNLRDRDVLIEFPSIEMPERKPPVGDMWFDGDGRLWVRLAWAEADDVLRAHVYDPDGGMLFTAEWPRGIDLSLGGVSGDVALGVQRMEFDVQRVVRLRFSPP